LLVHRIMRRALDAWGWGREGLAHEKCLEIWTHRAAEKGKGKQIVWSES
jgi:hypothetical protein